MKTLQLLSLYDLDGLVGRTGQHSLASKQAKKRPSRHLLEIYASIQLWQEISSKEISFEEISFEKEIT